MTQAYKAHKILGIIESSPVIWSDGREVVQITFEKGDYNELLKLLIDLEKPYTQPVPPHRTKI